MVEWFIVMAFWAEGNLHNQTRKGFVSEEQCERALPRDIAEFKRQFGNAAGKCNASPPRPEDMPEPKPKGTDV